MHDLIFNPPLKSHNCTQLYISNCDKDGSIVSARIASSVEAVSSTRPIRIKVDRQIDSSYFKDMANRLASYYSFAGNNSLLNSDILVLSSVHRAALYVAEVLHAPLLPLQIISFAKSWEQALEAKTLSIAGSDFDAPYIWQWNKIGHISHFPQKYIDMMYKASKLVLVRTNDNSPNCRIEGKFDKIYINSTLKENKYSQNFWLHVKNKLNNTDMDYSSIRHWEWGLPDLTVDATKQMWLKLGKSIKDFHIVEGSSVDLYRLITPIWEYYLVKNLIPVRGFTFNSYWIAHPYYERYAGLLPIHFYKFKMLEETAAHYIQKYKNIEILPNTVCAFTNNAGGPLDTNEIKNFLTNFTFNKKCWFSIGFDCPDAQCRDVFGNEIPKPFEKVCEWIQSAPYRKNNFTPMTINEVERLV